MVQQKASVTTRALCAFLSAALVWGMVPLYAFGTPEVPDQDGLVAEVDADSSQDLEVTQDEAQLDDVREAASLDAQEAAPSTTEEAAPAVDGLPANVSETPAVEEALPQTDAAEESGDVQAQGEAVSPVEATPISSDNAPVEATPVSSVNASTTEVVEPQEDAPVLTAQAMYDISDADIDYVTENRWTGYEVRPTVTVTYGSVLLVEGVDYTIAYADNVASGWGDIIIKGIGSYYGTVERHFEIGEDLAWAEIKRMPVQIWTGRQVTPKPVVTLNGKTLKLNQDYVFSYANNVNTGLEAEVWIHGIGAYYGETYENFTIGARPGTWRKSGSRWWYDFGNGSYAKNGFVGIGGKLYHFDSAGWMTTGWFWEPDDEAEGYGYWHYASSSGVVAKGWQKISGSWYYFEDRYYVMLCDTLTEVDGRWYYFRPSGAMATGWVKVFGLWANFAPSGAMRRGWLREGSTWYYLNSGGYMVTGRQTINGVKYYFSSSGAMQTGWQRINGSWYYFGPSGGMKTGWVKSGSWYWMDANGKMATGWRTISGARYWFASNGAMATGWQRIGGKWYYFRSSGAMARSTWIGNYYVGSDGVMV